MRSPTLAASLLLLALCLEQVSPARILVLYTFSSKSHKNFVNPIINALAEKGHELVVVAPYKTPTKNPNVTDIFVRTRMEDIFKVDNDDENVFSPFKNRENKGIIPFLPYFMTDIFLQIGEIAQSNPEYKNLVNEKFDLAIMCGFMNELNLGLVHKLGVPLIQTMAGPSMFSHSDLMGSPEPTSHIPNMFLDLGEEMNFFERFKNLLAKFFVKFARSYMYLPKIDAFIKKHYPDITMSVQELEKNVTSLILTNSHFSINHARPHLPTIIEVGCTHCVEAKPLPKEFLHFIEGSGEHGVIYFSFGSVVQTQQMPEEVRLAFVEAFKELPQRVLWKYHDEKMEGLPKNVKLSSWMPQQDILAHPKIRVFITHGGMLSTQESVYHEVPVIGVPFFGDQDTNINQAARQGRAVRLDVLDKEHILIALRTVLNDNSYQKRAHELSVVLKDQNPPPLERAVFWIEYVLRHNGAHHLKAVAADMPWYQYHLVDVFAVLALVILAAVFVLGLIVKIVLKVVCSFLSKKDSSKGKKKRE